MHYEPPPLWPHQAKAVGSVEENVMLGVRRLILCSPTGGGKSRVVGELIKRAHYAKGLRSVVFTNRKLLVTQLTNTLAAFGLDVGVRAAGKRADDERPVQVSSVQTEHSRVYKKRGHIQWELFPADLVFFDEAHLQGGVMAARLKADYAARGAVVIEVTATPVDLEPGAEVLVQAGVNSELRACGALVFADHFGPDEPDLRHIGRTEVNKGDDLSEPEQRNLMGKVDDDGKPSVKLQRLFGRVFEWFERLNPAHKPTILFAPGVPESMWFAQEFSRRGVSAAHIDGESVWTAGSGEVKTSEAARNELLEMSRDGSVKVLCNRFVLREGIDCPWLAHGILATRFGSLSSYLQSGGRLLRAFNQLVRVSIQDHGGNWWAHGSLNADRTWPLGCSSRVVAGVREDGLRKKATSGEKEPWRCPRCALVMMGLRCVCGFVLDPRAKTRPVVQENGSLIQMAGDVFVPRRTEERDDTLRLWTAAYFQAKNSKKGMSFRQAIGNFYQAHGYFPPETLPYMPKAFEDQFRLVREVEYDHLIPPPKKEAA